MATTLPTTASFWVRVKAAAPAAQFGPGYRRAVRDELATACRCWDKGDREYALVFLARAEEAAR